ncbi:MAG: phytanoyl-CoA dioxygenase family protein [Chthonomonadales bacterium]
MEEPITCNELLLRPSALREHADQSGYLFFRHLVDRAAIEKVRRGILALCARAGWLAAGTDPAEGIAAPGVAFVEPQPQFMEVYDQVMRLESFHALAHDAGLTAVFQALFGETVLVHPRNIARIIFPHNVRFTTPAHQDYVHIQGTQNTWTAWIPLGDCPRDLGGLAVMPGSHRNGVYPVHSAYGAGGLGINTDVLPFGWVTTDYRAGDAILFHSLTVHKALPNLTDRRIRLSTDFRYQPASEPVTQASLLPHYARLTWDEIYSGWTSARYQYYWRGLPLTIAEWTPQFHQSAEPQQKG